MKQMFLPTMKFNSEFLVVFKFEDELILIDHLIVGREGQKTQVLE